MQVSLVIMAAGLGSRYGGSKQVDGIGPNGEILMEYSIYDALRAGFNKVVFIIKPEMQEMMDGLCGAICKDETTAGRQPGGGGLRLSGFFLRAGFLPHPGGAHQALRHGPRPAVRGGGGPRALLRHQCRRLLRDGRLPHHL